MRAAIYQGANQPLTIERVCDPRPKTDEVVIAVARAGICGSDLHMAEYGFAPAGTIFGHEFAGTIVECGAKVDGWAVGDRVTALPLHACSRCDACNEGLPGLYRSGVFTGTSLLAQGAYAQYVVARAAMLQRLPAGVGFDEGAMVEPLAVAHHAVAMADLGAADDVLVIGAGPIGVAVALFARLAGARSVVVSERFADRRALALAAGASAAIDPGAGPVAAAFSVLAGRAPPVVFECVGAPGLIQQCIDLAGIRGRVVVAGACFQDDAIKPITGLAKEVSLRFSQCYTERDFEAVIGAIAAGRADPEPLHTRTIGFDDLPAAFDALRKPSADCKILIDPAA
jgi:(R,R)-butanediol dehydrogenase/meso-butanediol dehydrogenase/diacetyl reductase